LQERYDLFFSAAPAGLAVIDDGLRFIQINESLARINGLAVEEHLGKTVQEVVPNIATAVVPTMKRILETGEPVWDLEIEGETMADPGNLHWWSGTYVPLYGWDGQPCGLCALVVDVTSQKRLEQELRENEAKYRMLMQESSYAVLVFDEDGNIEDVNRRACEMFHYTRGDLCGLNVRDLIPAEDLAVSPIQFQDLLAGKTVRRTRRLRCKDGLLLQVEITGLMVGQGRMQAMIRDISGLDRPASEGVASHQREASGARVSLLREMSEALADAAQILEQVSSQRALPQPDPEPGIDFYNEVSRFEIDLIKRALKLSDGKQKQAAALLGMKQTTLHAMIKRYRIDLSE
jgi:PAS domain S-box-containing protein